MNGTNGIRFELNTIIEYFNEEISNPAIGSYISYHLELTKKKKTIKRSE